MDQAVIRLILANDKILIPVIVPHAVNVMDNLARLEKAAKDAFGH
jgi:hypothetical protein